MLLDSRLEFADALGVTGTAGAKVAIGSVIDLGTELGGAAGATDIGRDIGLGEDLWLVLTVDTEIITGGSAGSVAFSLNSNATADLAGTPTEHYISNAAVTGAAGTTPQLAVGALFAAIRLPSALYQRYLVLGETIGTTTITAGKLNAFLTKDLAKYHYLPNAVGA